MAAATAAGQALRLCVRGSRGSMSSAPRVAPRAAMTPRGRQQRRAFAASTARRADDADAPVEDSLYKVQETVADMIARLKPDEVTALDGFRKTDPSAQGLSLEQYLERQMSLDENAEEEPLVTPREWKAVSAVPRGNRASFWYDEDDPTAPTDDVMDEFDEDDMTPMAHAKLDEIREHRHYNRIIAWEMPLLSKLAKPFTPPAADDVLRFRYTTYMGEHHPAEKKVVVQFSPADVELTPVQADKLRKLAGARYHPAKDVVKMSSERFEHQAQNKRYLSDMVDKLIAAAKDPKDTFADIPLDTRHVKTKSKPRFPVEWRMTEERQRELNELRLRSLQDEASRVTEGQVVDGTQKIESALEAPAAEGDEAEKVAVPRGGRRALL
ncbi:37S ribosomal protein S24 [Colletotrichum orbiculare MAFF 240422]|uniref:37S ribosomal protein S24 n=1 Tax=Colletotrichum orbiculare (strain 104-T / ATCC 96160 / CBS 514.97 / LARS 414 / MAFF 240422) TaxID=1213857 RepID=N4VBV0_COLOR|nr:37S ribosomal protein S24 [Colletotrichum orbiculare MAFF 240422]